MRTSEYVSLGHPDKIADYISEYILDRYLEKDKYVKYALEVQIKGNFVSLAGEISSDVKFSNKQLSDFVKQAVSEIGYDQDYMSVWGKENAICSDNLEVLAHISHQSPDIYKGVKKDGWGDQGIFWGYAENNPSYNYMPYDHFLARELCQKLYNTKIAGLDIKTQITLNDDNKICKVVVAIPIMNKLQRASVAELVKAWMSKYPTTDCNCITINGTGEYIMHSPIGDCGMTGRKLAVDFYGGCGRVGGGSPWTKDGSKADLTLNLLARRIAKANLIYNADKVQSVEVGVSCCIGHPDIFVTMKMIGKDGGSNSYDFALEVSPNSLVETMKLNTPIFSSLCRHGLFYNSNNIWENVSDLSDEFIYSF